MTRRMRELRRELALDCKPDVRSEKTLYWVPLSPEGRAELKIRLALQAFAGEVEKIP